MSRDMLIRETLENLPSLYKEGIKKIKNSFPILNSELANYPTDTAIGLAYKRFRKNIL